jgi:hypothetical protein
VLVFEDLIDSGYIVKPKQLNLEETKFVISKLAKWHATSFCLGKNVRKIKNFFPNKTHNNFSFAE